MGQTRVLIIDDHETLRSALVTKLSRDQDLRVIGTAAATDGDLEQGLRCKPDVVLLDVKRRDGNGIRICREIVRMWPLTRVLILPSYLDEGERGETEATGAVGYLLKDLDLRKCSSRSRFDRGNSLWGKARGGE
ncbi:MAG: response regulator transcription factor [Candidatus Methylomirabilales bacterium]